MFFRAEFDDVLAMRSVLDHCIRDIDKSSGIYLPTKF